MLVYSLASCCLSLGVDGVDQPFHAFVEALLRNGTACLNVPGAVSDVTEFKGVHNFSCLECEVQVLLVCEDEQRHACEELLT